MQDNHFEKDIAKKLGNFPVQPSEKVWQDIEATLTKPDRRRFAWWWVPLLLLLLGGIGGYFLYINSHKENDTVLKSNTNPESKGVELAQENRKLSVSHEPFMDSTVHQQGQAADTNKPIDFSYNKTASTVISDKQPASVNYNNNRKRNGVKKRYGGAASAKITNAGVYSETINASAGVQDNSVTAKPPSADTERDDKDISTGLTNIGIAIVEGEKPPKKPINTVVKENKSSDTVAKPMLAKKSINKKQLPLKIALSLFGGSAELSYKGLQEKQLGMASLYLAGPLNQNNVVIREVLLPHNRFRIGAGVLLKYPLSKKFSLVSGLQYGYVKNKMRINISRDTIIGASFSTVYSTALNGNFSMHKLNVPLLISFDMLRFKKGVVNIVAGADNNLILAQRQKNMPTYFSKQRIYQPLLHFSANYVFPVGNKQLEIGPVFNTNLFSVIKEASTNYKWLYAGAGMKLYFK